MPMEAYKGPESDLKPEAEHIRAFVAWWFEHCTRGNIEIGWLDDRGYGLIHFAQFDKNNISELIATAYQANLVPGQSCYVRASTVNPRSVFSTETGYTMDTDFVQAPGIWSDIDTLEQMERAKAVQSMVRPNASVITGNLPHMRVQNWFKASEPIVSFELVLSLNRRLRALYGGDPAVVNPTRLMRLPGTIAWPWKKDRTVAELTSFARPAPSDPRPVAYPLSMLTSQLPSEDTGSSARPSDADMKATLNTVSEFVRLIRAGASWHDAMIRLVAHWIGRGWSNAEILLAVGSLPQDEWRNKIDWHEVQKAIDGGRKKWGVPNQEHTIGTTPDSPFPSQIINPWDALQPPAFPIHALPGILQEYVESRARIMGSDPCAIAWAAISACSAAIDGRVRLRLKKHDSWSVPPPIWVALVGRSSAKKTPVINDVWHPLIELQNIALNAYGDQLKRWNALSKDEKKSIEPPPRPRRLVSHDVTMESLQGILGCQDRGIGIVRDELAGFIGAMDKYSGSGNGGAADRAFWLQSYNGGSHTVDRVGRGTTAINNLLATICGGIQPDRLAKFTDLSDDGLWQRFVPIIMRASEMGTDEPPGDCVLAFSERLKGLVEASVATSAALSDAAHEIRAQVERDVYELEQAEPFGSRFASFTGKLPGLFGRLCIVLSYVEPSGLGYIVHENVARMARTLIFKCVIPHAARVYSIMGAKESGGMEDMQAVAGYILAKRVDRLVSSDLGRKVRSSFRAMSVQKVNEMLSPLISGGWLVPENESQSNRVWLVNPLVHTIFGDRAEVEAARRRQAHEILTGDAEGEDE